MKIKRKLALLTVLIIIMNLFAPYSILFNNTVQAASQVIEDKPIVLSNLGITQKGANRVLAVQVALSSETIIKGMDLQFKADSTKLTPCNKNTGAAATGITMISTQSGYCMSTFQKKTYTKTTNAFRITTTEPTGGTDFVENGYVPGTMGDNFGDPELDELGKGLPTYYPLITLYFKVLDDSLTNDNITLDLFTLIPVTGSLPTGGSVSYVSSVGGNTIKNITEFHGQGFAEAEKAVTGITVKTPPTKTNYEHGDTVNLTGGEITITYDDGTTEDISMKDPNVSIQSGSPVNKDTAKVTISYKGKTTEFPITVIDPVVSFAVKTPMTNLEYTHDQNLNFTGLTLEATTKSGSKIPLTQTSAGVTTSAGVSGGALKADVNSTTFTKTSPDGEIPVKGTQKVTFTYEGFSAYQTIVVNDTISSVNITNQPSKAIYKAGETLNLAGAVVQVTLGSGAKTNINLPDGAVTISSHNTGLVGAKQLLTATVAGKTAPETIDIEYYDYITKTELVEPDKVEYNLNETLNLTNGRIKATWKQGGLKSVVLTQAMVSTLDSSTAGTKTLTVTYNVEYTLSDGTKIPDTFTHTFDVEVINNVNSISITPPTKTSYNHGENLSTDGTITLHYADGTTSTVPYANNIVVKETDGTALNMSPASYPSTQKISKTVELSYTDVISGKKGTANYTFDLINDLKSITVHSTNHKTSYNIGEPEDLTNLEIRAKRAVGEESVITVKGNSAVTVTGFNSSTAVATLPQTITYTENGIAKSTTFNISVANGVTGVTITPPTKTTYKHGEGLDLSTGSINLTYADNSTGTLPITDATITEIGGGAVNMSPASYDSTQKVAKTLIISYTDPTSGKTATANYPIEIINDIKSIAVNSSIHKVSYNVNDTLNTDNLTILVTRAVGTETVTVKGNSKAVVKNFNSTKENTNLTLTIEYTENGIMKSTTYNVSITDQVTAINSITFPHTKYKHNEELNLTGAKINVQKGSGAVDVDLSIAMITGYNKDTLGDQKLTISYGGQTMTDAVTVNVKDYVTEITLSQSNIEGTYGEELQAIIDRLNLTYTVHYSKAGAEEAVKVATSMIDGYNKNTTTTQNLQVVYRDNNANSYTVGDDFDKDINITLRNSIVKIDIKKPTKSIYKHGESIDKTGGTVTLTYANGDKQPGDISKLKITESDDSTVNMSPSSYDSTNKLAKTLKLSYTEGGKTETADYPIEIINDIKGITVHSTNHKKAYNVNDSLDITNLEILVTRASGAPEVIRITDPSKVTGFNSSTENTSLPLTVSYTENGITKTTSYNVSITDQVTAINSVTFPHKNYKYNDELNLDGAKINVQKGSGAVDVPLTTAMITGYHKDTIGNHTLTISYGGQTDTSVVVNVKDYVTGITLNKTNVNGEYGNELVKIISDNTITYTINYAKAGATTPTALATSMVKTAYDKNHSGSQILDIEYIDSDTNSFTNGTPFKATLTVNLTSQIKTVTISEPTKKNYTHGEALDLTGGTITFTYSDNTTRTEPITSATVAIEDNLDKTGMRPATYGATNQVTKNVTLTYRTSNGKTGTVTYPIVITNTIEKIEIATSADGAGITAPKTEYKVKELFDDTKGSIKVTRKNGDTSIIPLSNGNISIGGFNSATENTSLPLTVSYTENGITKNTSYTISVKDSIESILSVNLPKKNYKYNEELDLTGATITVQKSSGAETITLKANMITGYTKTKLGNQELTISYGGKTAKVTVNVADYIQDTIFTRPTKTTYEYGATQLDLTGGKIKKIMASGASTPDILLTDSSVTLSGYNLNQEGAQTVTVKYRDKTFSFGIIVEDNVQSIVMKETPKITYKYGEPLDVTNGKITVTKSSGKTQDVVITASMVSNFSPNKLGEQTLKVTYKGKETTYKVEVKDYVRDILLTAPSKNVYKIGESLDLKGGTVQTVMASGAKGVAEAITESMISDFSTKTEGAKTVKVTYQGKTKTFPITVVDSVQDIRLKTLPTKLDYKYGEALDVKGGSIEIIKASGNKTIALTSSMVKGYDAKKLGVQTLKVVYEGKEIAEFKVDVKDYIAKLDVKPSKTEYEYGESLDLKGAKVSVITASGKIQETVDMTASMISGFDNTKVGKQAIIVNYLGLKSAFNVEVTDKVKGIAIEKHPNKINFAYGEEIDVTGGTLEVIKSSGKSSVKITKDMISGYNKNQSGAQVITVTYSGFTTKFIVVVGEKPVKPVTPTKPVTPNKPTAPTPPKVEIPEKPVVEEPVKPVVPETPVVQEPVEEKPEEKPTAVLGVQEEKPDIIIPTVIGGTGLLMLLLLLATKRNTKVYVEEEGKFELGGGKKLSKRHPYIDIDKYLDGETYLNKVKVELNKKISKQLNGKELRSEERRVGKECDR